MNFGCVFVCVVSSFRARVPLCVLVRWQSPESMKSEEGHRLDEVIARFEGVFKANEVALRVRSSCPSLSLGKVVLPLFRLGTWARRQLWVSPLLLGCV